jgi:hypothetical protein
VAKRKQCASGNRAEQCELSCGNKVYFHVTI